MFARVLFSQNFAYAKLCENKIFAKRRITLSTTDIGELYPSRENFQVKSKSFNDSCEIKILAKTSGYTV